MAIWAINLRSTSGFITDPAGSTFLGSIGDLGLAAEIYPVSKTAGGLTFDCGIVVQTLSGVRDRDNTLGHLAGLHFSQSLSYPVEYRFDCGSGRWKLRLALGDATGGATSVNTKVYDGDAATGTLLTTITGSIATGEFMDATGANHTSAANWEANNSPLTISTTINGFLTVTLEADLAPFAHLSLEQILFKPKTIVY